MHNNRAFLKIYCDTLLINYRKNGFFWIIKKVILKMTKELVWLLLLPISITLHLLNFRRLPIRVEHVGHLTSEIDTFLKAKYLKLILSKKYFILAPINKVSNKHLLHYWSPKVMILTQPFICTFIALLTKRYFMQDRSSGCTVGHFGTQPIYAINKQWGDRKPLLSLNENDLDWANNELPKLGIQKDQWFICLHVREGGFLPHNESIQAHRNASINNTMLAIQEIIKRGGMVVRMGDSSMSVFPPMEGVIDYAHHPLKSERMDVVLCAKAKFFLGCTSGLAFLSMVFGVPVAHSNMIPVETLGLRPYDISISKLLIDHQSNRYFTFPEMMSSKMGGFFYTHQYKEAEIDIQENTSDEIFDLLCEMLDRLEGRFHETKEDAALHSRYLSLIKPGHYSYGAASKICIAFLRKYQYLMDDVK